MRPQVREHALGPGDVAVILASDGLWDVMSNAEAAGMVAAALLGVEAGGGARAPASKAASARRWGAAAPQPGSAGSALGSPHAAADSRGFAAGTAQLQLDADSDALSGRSGGGSSSGGGGGAHGRDPGEAARGAAVALVDEALRRGSGDNVTALVIDVRQRWRAGWSRGGGSAGAGGERDGAAEATAASGAGATPASPTLRGDESTAAASAAANRELRSEVGGNADDEAGVSPTATGGRRRHSRGPLASTALDT